MDLINRRNAIKRAVSLSNAVAKINVGGVEYTVAEAIAMKHGGMDNFEYLLERITTQYGQATTACRIGNDGIVENATRALKEISGNGEFNADEARKFIDDFVKNQQLEVISGIDCVAIMEELEEKISTFESKVDSALSISNATTIISFEY